MAFKKKIYRRKRNRNNRKSKPNKVFVKKVRQVLDQELEMMTYDRPIAATYNGAYQVGLQVTNLGLVRLSDTTYSVQLTTGMLRIPTIATGTELGERIGNVISLKRLEMVAQLTIPSDCPTVQGSTFKYYPDVNIVLILFRYKTNGIVAPPNDIFHQIVSTSAPTFQLENELKKSQYKIIKRKRLTLRQVFQAGGCSTTGGSHNLHWNLHFKKPIKLVWNNNAADSAAPEGDAWNSGAYTNNSIYFTAYSDYVPSSATVLSDADTPIIQGAFRLHYHTD